MSRAVGLDAPADKLDGLARAVQRHARMHLAQGCLPTAGDLLRDVDREGWQGWVALVDLEGEPRGFLMGEEDRPLVVVRSEERDAAREVECRPVTLIRFTNVGDDGVSWGAMGVSRRADGVWRRIGGVQMAGLDVLGMMVGRVVPDT